MLTFMAWKNSHHKLPPHTMMRQNAAVFFMYSFGLSYWICIVKLKLVKNGVCEMVPC